MNFIQNNLCNLLLITIAFSYVPKITAAYCFKPPRGYNASDIAINKEDTQALSSFINEPRKVLPSKLALLVAVHESKNLRDYMEDRHIIDPKKSLFGVLDGHKGSETVDYIQQNIGDCFDRNNGDLVKTFESIDLEIKEKKLLMSGSTAVIAHIKGGREAQAIIANTGDSRAILIRNNKVLETTIDHKPDDLREIERINKARGKIFYFSGALRLYGEVSCLAMSRSLGDWGVEKNGLIVKKCHGLIATPDIYTWPLQKEDILVLASDGIWDQVSNEAITQEVAKLDSLDKNLFAQRLCALAKAKGSQDNLTAMVVHIK